MKNCPLTELPTIGFMDCGYSYKYEIVYDGDKFLISLGHDYLNCSNSQLFKDTAYLFAGAILNKQLIEGEVSGYKVIQIGSEWKEKISKIIYPQMPKDKMDNLLKTLYLFQKYDGEEVNIRELAQKPAFWYKHFFKNSDECCFYFRILQSQNLIEVTFTGRTLTNPTISPIAYVFTLHGLNYYLDITESGRLSNKCFVAMAFSDETKEIREAIREALKVTGFDPIIIDEQHIDSHKTINDAIIAELKGAKFCIADFTMQRGGAYFESGFAVGQGKSVIYCCRKDHWKDTHFDTNHFAHILYDKPSELKESLINKINAWIK